jgi:uncharacterized protein with PIN domain
MDSTSNTGSLDDVADMVVEILVQSGKLADLENADLETIEEEVLASMDSATRDAISKLLLRQRRQTKPPQSCPQCGQPLSAKPAQGRSMQSTRGRIRFKCDVFRCEACRLDFFPSIQNSGL